MDVLVDYFLSDPRASRALPGLWITTQFRQGALGFRVYRTGK